MGRGVGSYHLLLEVKSDALEVIKLLNREAFSYAAIDVLIEDILSLLSFFVIVLVRRTKWSIRLLFGIFLGILFDLERCF